MLKIKLKETFSNIFIYVITPIIVILRHVNLTFEESVSIVPFVIIGLIVLVPFIIYTKKKNKIMRIHEAKEIEDNERKVSTILYFYLKFAIKYFLIFLMLFYVQFNFKALTGTMELIGISLLAGAALRINATQNKIAQKKELN